MFAEVFHPIVNGVVASIDSLRFALQRDGVSVTAFVPDMHDAQSDDANVVRFPSLPLPTSTGYRLCIPLLSTRDRERARALDIVHAHSPFVSGWYAAAIARRMRIPLIYTYHTQFDAYAHYAPFEPRIVRRAMIALTRAFANRADIVIAPTHAMRERLRSLGVRARIDVVPTAIDAERFRSGRRSAAVRALLGADERARLVLVVARLGREKNIDVAIDAMMSTSHEVVLAIVGEGPQRTQLARRIRERALGARVRLAGAFAPALMPSVYASADVFAFTSLTDTQGLVLGEARAAGLPVIAVESPVAREIVGDAGEVVPNDPRALAAAIERAPGRRPADTVSRPEAEGSAAYAAAVRAVYAAAIAGRRETGRTT